MMIDQDYYKNRVVKHRRILHEIPELEFNLPQTSKYICDILKELGVEYEIINNVHIFAHVICNQSINTVLLRADMDALNITEKTNLNFKSNSGNMHACGHDAHMAMQLTIIEILKNNENLCNFNVDVVFQAGEETLQGGKQVVEFLLDKNLKYDKILSTHIFSKSNINSLELIAGTIMPSCDHLSITVESCGGHGATPEECISAIDIGCDIITNVKSMLATKLGLSKNAVVSFGQFSSGNSSNIIPGEATLKGTIRCISEDVRKMVSNELESIKSSLEIKYQCKIIINYISSCPALHNDSDLIDESYKRLKHMKNVHMSNKLILVSEDFAYYNKLGKSAMFILNAKKNNGYPQHHNEFDINEDALITYCKAIYELLCVQ